MAAGSDRKEINRLEMENRHLKEMVGVLRDELEKMRIEEQDRLQRFLAGKTDEINQLKQTVTVLRDELEQRRFEYEERCQTLERAGRDEARQLQEMIQAMRDKLEAYGVK